MVELKMDVSSGSKEDINGDAYKKFLEGEYSRRHSQQILIKPAVSATNPYVRFIKKHKVLSVIIAVILVELAVSSLAKVYVGAIFLLFLLITSLFSAYKMKWLVYIYGPELVTFGTVLIGAAFGPFVGLIFGVLSATISEIKTFNIGAFTWLYILSLGFVGFMSGVLNVFDIAWIGILSTIFILAVNQAIYLSIADGETRSIALMYVTLNLAINITLFVVVGERVLDLIVL